MIVNTPIFPEFLVDVGWSQTKELDLLNTIYRYLSALLLTRAETIVFVKTDDAVDWTSHPCPLIRPRMTTRPSGKIEMGKLLCLHDEVAQPGEFFLGVACHNDFETTCVEGYRTAGRAFPLVSKGDLSSLTDGFVWEVSPHLHNKSLPYVDA